MSQWENGKSGVSVESIKSIAQIVGVDVGWLLNGPKTDTMFLDKAGELSRVPVILAEDTFLIASTEIIGAKYVPAFEVLTDTTFVGSSFAIYVFDNVYGGDFALGDLLIFDTEYELVEGAILLATVIQSAKSAPKSDDAPKSMYTSLFRVTVGDRSRPISFSNVILQPLDRTASPNAQHRFFPAGRLVERRTYHTVTPERLRNLKSHLTTE